MKHFKGQILRSQIQAAVQAWEEIQSQLPAPADRRLANFFYRYRRKFGGRDKRFISSTIYALLRNKSFLELWAMEFKKSDPCRVLILLAAALEGTISEGEFNAEFSGMPQDSKRQHALYKHLLDYQPPNSWRASSGVEDMAIRYSCPLWLVERWTGFWGEEACRSLLSAMRERPPLVIRINPLKISRSEMMERFREKGFGVFPTKQSPFGIVFEMRTALFDSEEFQEGFFEIQDEGSQLVCQKMDVRPGEIIWDVCAGGGGKSLLLAALMQNQGRIIATDIRAKKLDDLKKRAKRAGVFNIFPADLNRMGEIREVRKGGIHKILVDAPCSGTGTFRRNPDAKWKLQLSHLENYHRDQVSIVEKAIGYLKPGAKLYYVTCSVDPIENEEVIREILSHHKQLRVFKLGKSNDGFFRVSPDRDGTDGFFMAGLECS